jgi:hypothetical protein
MPRFQAVTILELQYPGGLLMSVMAYPDGAGNTFECWGVNDGTNRGFALVVRKNQAGAETGRWEVEPTADMKADFASIMQTGPHIDVYLANHMPGAQNPEIMKGQKYRLENVAVPYPNGFAPIGAPGAYAPDEGQQGGGGVTIEELVAELTNSQSDLHKAMARLVKNNAQIGADNALDQQGLTPEHIKGEVEELFGRLEEGGSTIVAQRIENEAYEGSIEAHKISRDTQEEN